MAEDLRIEVKLHADDEDWTVDLADFTGVEWRTMKQHMPGLTMASAWAGVNALDAEVLAVVLWAWRHRDEPKLAYEAVLETITIRSMGHADANGEVADGAGEGVDVSDPEA